MRLLVVALRRQYNAKASVVHFGNCKSSQHCETRCKSLMSFKRPEMRELPVKGSSVFSTERDERQCGCHEACLLANHCKQKIYAEFDLATLSPTSAATRQHSFRVLAYHQAQQWIGTALDLTVWGGMVKYGRMP